jgi:Berberine and berberine like.
MSPISCTKLDLSKYFSLQIIIANGWPDSASPQNVTFIRHLFKEKQLPLLKGLAGPDSGSYSNEGDPLESDFQRTFYGPNYARLSQIKRRYDSRHLFIVAAGVGSEDWDEWGLCCKRC